MADFYCYVEDGVIQRYNITKPTAHGNISFGENTTDAEFAEHGYFANLGEAPAYDPATERLEGPVYVLGEGVVTRSYTVVPFSADELAAKEAELVKAYDGIVQGHLDAVARSFGYGDPNRPEISPILHAISYAEEPAVERFMNEGKALRAWRSQVWSTAAGILNAVKAGTRAIPTEAELLAELPAAPTQAPL